MNYCLLPLFFFLSLKTPAQHPLVRQSIEDDGRHLVVEFDFVPGGTLQPFRRTFDVQEFSKTQKQALLRSLVDSLGLPPQTADVALLDSEVPASAPADPLATAAVPSAAAWTEPVPAREARPPLPVPRSACPAHRNRSVRPTTVP